MADEKKKQLYGGSYDEQIRETANQIQNRPAFRYDLDGDALYQQYKDRYTQNAKLGMKDAMGQAASLTGGYGSSYAQGVGQQRYDETMRGLTDMIPTLEQSAYQRWRDRGTDLRDQFSTLNSLASTEQATSQQAYSQLAQLISSSGYQPTEEELSRAGMSAEQANAIRQMWIASNPQLAYNNGQLSPEDFYKLTGMYPIGYTPETNSSSGSGYYAGSGYYGGGIGTAAGASTAESASTKNGDTGNGASVDMSRFHSQREFDQYLKELVSQGEVSPREATELRDEFSHYIRR